MKRILLIAALLYTVCVYGQHVIKGSVKNYDNAFEPITCSIMLYPKIDSLFLKKLSQPLNHYHFRSLKLSMSDMKGNFKIKNIPVNKIDLLLSALGFEKMLIKNITFNDKDTLSLNNVYMLRTSTITSDGNMQKGDLESKWKKNDAKFKMEYPKEGRELKMVYKNGMVIIDYKDLQNYNKN